MKQGFGYDTFFEEGRKRLGLEEFSVARVIAEHRGLYRVVNAEGEFQASVTGKQMFEATSREDYPAVGDWVAIADLGEGQAVIRGILPRRSIIKRNHGDKDRVGKKHDMQVIAANIDVALIVESVHRDFSLNRFERYIAIAEDSGIQPAIILNKVDLLTENELQERLSQLQERFPTIKIIFTSVVTDAGLDELREYLQAGKTYCFLGSSGVGKSSLINQLLGEEVTHTRAISEASDRGTHVTTSRQMYILENGAMVIDNPGIREVGLASAERGVALAFDDIEQLAEQCRYADCTHAHEPGCAVRGAALAEELDAGRYQNYLSLKKEAEFYDMSDFERRDKDKEFGKFLKQAKKDLRNLDGS